MRALSFSQPWLWAVLYAGKHIENRTWAPPVEMIGKSIALHAAKSWDGDGISYLCNLGIEHPGRRDLYPSSCIVGVATIDYVRTSAEGFPEDQRKWFFGPFGWYLSNIRILPVTVPATGKLGLWHVSEADLPAIHAQLEAA
jgi:hypothetical protein